MAIVLEFDGVDDCLSLLEPFNLSDGDFIDFEIIQGSINSGFEMWAGTWNTGVGDAGQWYFGKLNSSNGVLTLFNRNGGGRSSSASGVLVDGEQAVFRLERVGDTLRVLKDNVQVISPLAFNAGNLDLNQIKKLFKENESGTSFCFTGQAVSVVVDTRYDFDINGSVHTAGTPIVTETIAGKDATGVNMPTAALGQPGSAWIDLGGGGISLSVTLGSIDYASQNATVQLSGVVDVSATLGLIDYSSQNTTVQLSGNVDIVATLGAISYTSQSTVVQLSGAINLNATLGSIDYSSQNPIVQLSGEIIANATLGLIDYSSNNTTVSLSGGINLSTTLGQIDYSSQSTVITLQGEISIPVTLGQISYNSNNVIIGTGQQQIIGVVTAGFAADLYASEFAPDLYTAGFKPDVITVKFKT